jgi:hypothetical protein
MGSSTAGHFAIAYYITVLFLYHGHHIGFQMNGWAPPGCTELGSLLEVALWDNAFDGEYPFRGSLHEYFVRVQRETAELEAARHPLPKKGNIAAT